MAKKKRYWLFKSEPSCFSIDDLQQNGTEHWDGVRNYQARNLLRDEMQKGDEVIFYHSSCKIPAAVGTATIVKAGYPDFTAEDPKSEHPDPKHTAENPRWYMVDIAFKAKFLTEVPLTLMRATPSLVSMRLLQKGNRLSVFEIEKKHFDTIVAMGK